MMDNQLFQLFNQRLDTQDEMLRDIRSSTKDVVTKLDTIQEKTAQHETAMSWMKRVQWAAWTAIGLLFGDRISH